MKKRFIGTVMAAVMIAGIAAGCGSGSSSSAAQESTGSAEGTQAASESAQAASETGTSDAAAAREAERGRTQFIVGFDAEYPPYGYMSDDGTYTGFDLELAEKVCEMEGWELVKTPVEWNSKDMELASGAIDCIWNGFTINGREDDYEWSVPYADNSQVIVVSDKSGITSLADLSGKLVGVQAASAALTVLQDAEQQKALSDTFSDLQQFSDYNVAFTELQAGSLDALAIDIGVANYQISSRGEGYVILEETLNSEQYGVGFKKGNTTLRDIINDDLAKLSADGTIAELADKYEISDLICLN